MPRSLTIIVILLIVVVKIVGHFATQAAKKKQQAQIRARAQGAPPGSGRPSASTPAQVSSRPGARPGVQARLDDLAARRKVQLEQLRRKRQAATTKPAQPSARTATQMQPSSATPPSSRPQPVAIDRPEERRTREQAAKRAAARESESKERRSSRRRRSIDSVAVQSPVESGSGSRRAEPSGATRLAEVLRSASGLRQAILMKEIIDSPISIRGESFS